MNDFLKIKEASMVSDGDLDWEYPDDIRALVMAHMFAGEIQDIKARENITGQMKYYYKKTAGARKTALLILLLMFIFSKPAWCQRLGEDISDTCQVDVDGNSYYTIIPSFISPKVSNVITFLCMFFIFGLQYLKISSSPSPDRIDVIKFVLMIVLVAFKLIFFLMEAFNFMGPSDIGNVIKLLFVMIYFKSIIKSFSKIYQMILSSGSMVLMTVLVLFVFSTLSRVFLEGIELGAEEDEVIYGYSFTSFGRSVDSLFLLMIMENFPDICLDSAEISAVIMIFFYFYILVSAIVIISLLTGVFYFYFKNFYIENLRVIGKKYPHFLEIANPFMDEAFLNPNAVDRIIKETRKIIKNEESDNPLSSREIQQQKKKSIQNTVEKVRRAIRKIKEMGLYEKTAKFSKYRNHFKAISNSFFYKMTVFMICLYNAFFPVFILDRDNLLSVTDYLQFSEFLSVIFLMELYMKFLFVTEPIFWSFDNICEFIASFGMIILTNILFMSPASLNDVYAMGDIQMFTLWAFCCFLKLVRIHVILMSYINYKVIIKTIKDIFPLIMDLLSMYIVILLFYGVIGMSIFGGRIHSGFQDAFNENTGEDPEDDWERFNMNDPLGALLFLFLQNLGGYLDFIHLGLGTISDSFLFNLARIYFYSFIILTELILINIIVGFIIDFLDVYMDNNSDIRENESKLAQKMKVVDILANNIKDSDIAKLDNLTNDSYNKSVFTQEEDDEGDEEGEDRNSIKTDSESFDDINPENHFNNVEESVIKESK